MHGKGDRARVTGIDPHSFAAIDRWVDKRKELGLGRRSCLFCSLQGKPLDTSYVRHLMKRLAVKAGESTHTPFAIASLPNSQPSACQ